MVDNCYVKVCGVTFSQKLIKRFVISLHKDVNS